MSIIDPNIDEMLQYVEGDKFRLCAVAAKRACDINDMMRGQRTRAVNLQSADDLVRFSETKPLSLAMEEIVRGDLGYVKETEAPDEIEE